MSQNQIILKHLKSGKSLTSWQAIQKWRITRLSGRIYDLIHDGHNIVAEMVQRNGKRFARYRLVA
jgi:hypothetical protein